jgi:hypothetical protein
MIDLEERFRELIKPPAPDLWEDIQRREPQRVRTPVASRLVAAAVALLVAGAAFAIVVRAFRPSTGSTLPGPQTSSTSTSPTINQTPTVFLAPHLDGASGWYSYSSVPAKEGDASYAWAATIPIDEADRSSGAVIPPATIERLPADGAVVTVEVVPSSYMSSSVPFPYARRSYELDRATTRGPEAEEPPGDYSVFEIDDPNASSLIRVYFGSSSPSRGLVDRAQQELDTLQLPPACAAPATGGYGVILTTDTGSPGDSITVSGPVPFQREDGSFDTTGDGQMIAWWNARPSDWEYLSSFSTTQPSPAVTGERVVRLGDAGMDACTFSIAFTIPEIPPGDYPIVVLQEGGGSATLEGSAVLHVTAHH